MKTPRPYNMTILDLPPRFILEAGIAIEKYFAQEHRDEWTLGNLVSRKFHERELKAERTKVERLIEAGNKMRNYCWEYGSLDDVESWDMNLAALREGE